MKNLFFILMFLAMFAVLVSLIMGIFSMLKNGDDTDKQKSNKLMRARVILQGVALLLFAIAISMGGSE